MQDLPPAQATTRPWHAWLARRARVIVVLSALGMILPWISRGLAGRDDHLGWAVDLAAHWQWLYLADLVFGTLVAASTNCRRSVPA